ncbi:MAG: tRNA (guanosine(46)-N7)-methyltransferase TrmB [Acidobacteria bacterium]|nr:tRNA (guanosine(46)-N7)-methyltransferase TrmB [Acidobacteriota bacterium]
MIAIDLNEVSVPLVWEELFGWPDPPDVEIGAGKGRFLLEMARLHPDRSLLGVERAAKYHEMVCRRAARRGIESIRMVRTTAEDLFFRLVKPSSVARIHIYFPDPWPKKRHHKRRLIRPEAVDAMARALVPGGRLLVKTDHPDYAEVIGEVLAASSLTVEDPASHFEDLPETSYEIKYRREDRPIWAFVCRRGQLEPRHA